MKWLNKNNIFLMITKQTYMSVQYRLSKIVDTCKHLEELDKYRNKVLALLIFVSPKPYLSKIITVYIAHLLSLIKAFKILRKMITAKTFYSNFYSKSNGELYQLVHVGPLY